MRSLKSKRSSLLVVVPALLGLLAAAAVLHERPPRYVATSRVFVAATRIGDDAAGAEAAVQQASRRVAPLATQPYVLHAVREELGLTRTSAELAADIAVRVRPGTSLISIAVTDPAERTAVDIANAVATRFTAAVGELETVGSSPAAIGAAVVGTASAEPVGADPAMWDAALPLGAAAGLLAGVALLCAVRRWRGIVQSAGDLDAAADAPAFVLPRADADGESDIERLVRVLDGRRVIAVGAASERERSSAVALRLARSFAASGRSVALVDGDLSHPVLAPSLGLAEGRGLSDALFGGVDVLQLVQPWRAGEHLIGVLPAGPVPARPGAMLLSPHLRASVRLLAQDAQLVILHLPPVLHGPEALLLSAQADATVLVARRGRSSVEAVQAAASALRGIGAPVRASVLAPARDLQRPARLGIAWRDRLVARRHGPALLPSPIGRESMPVEQLVPVRGDPVEGASMGLPGVPRIDLASLEWDPWPLEPSASGNPAA